MYVVNACTQVTAGTPVFGELHKDDVILELQNCDASRLTHKQAQDMIRNAGGSMLVRVRRSARVSLLPVCWRAAKSPRLEITQRDVRTTHAPARRACIV